jgi:hypothetical protein
MQQYTTAGAVPLLLLLLIHQPLKGNVLPLQLNTYELLLLLCCCQT